MSSEVRLEYERLSDYLGMEGKALVIDIAMIADIVENYYLDMKIKTLVEITPMIFSYFIGKGKWEKQEDRNEVINIYGFDLLHLIDDYLVTVSHVDLPII